VINKHVKAAVSGRSVLLAIIVIAFLSVAISGVVVVSRLNRHELHREGWLAGDQRLCTFLASYEVNKVGTRVLVPGTLSECDQHEFEAARRFLSYLLALKDATNSPVDLYGRVAANSEFRYTAPTDDTRTIATIRVYSNYGSGSSIDIWFEDNDSDRICIVMTPMMRREYQSTISALRREKP
jgi:hypothetical protein